MSEEKRKLLFAPPTVEGFREVLSPLCADGVQRVSLIGDNALADLLLDADWMQDIRVERTASFDEMERVDSSVILFTETRGEKLGHQLLSCLDRKTVLVAPVTEWHFSKKPLFLVSIPKAGTHLLYELASALGYHEGVEPPEFPIRQTWYCLEYSNSHTVAADFFVDTVRRSPFGNRHHSFMQSPTLFIYRHPLDILVSEAHYYHREGKTAFAGWLSQCDFQERLTRLLEDNWLLGSLRSRIGGFLPWLDFPNVIPFSFEELVGAEGGGSDEEQCDLIWSIQLKLQVPGNPEEFASRVFNSNSPTFRSGKIGEYQQHLSSPCIANFAKNNLDILQQLGYPDDGTLGLPVKKDTHRRRLISYSCTDYEGTPLTIESDFLGCNLVRFRGKIYAVPRALGSVAIERLSSAALAALPTAESLNEIKALLLIGRTNLTQYKHTLNGLAEVLDSQNVEKAFYWTEPPEGSVVEVYKGFNIVASRGYYLGIRQSIGPIDLSSSLLDLVRNFDSKDVVVSQSIVELKDDIDGTSASMRVRREFLVANEEIQIAIRFLESKNEMLQLKLTEQEKELSRLRESLNVRFGSWSPDEKGG